MKNIFKVLKFPVVTLLFIASFIACDSDFTTIESDVLGAGNSNLSSKDTILQVRAYNKKLDSLQVNGLPSNLLGFYNDPAYGKTTASIVAQVIPSSYSPDFGTNPVIDSISFYIPYFSRVTGLDDLGNSEYALDSIYGDVNAPVKLSIYQNTYYLRDFDPNAPSGTTQQYYSNAYAGTNSILDGISSINLDEYVGELIKDTIFKPSAKATFIGTATDTTRSVPAYKFNLTKDEEKAFWKSTIIDKAGTNVLENANNFKDYFRGIYFKAEPINDNGNMTLLDLSGASITIHYTYGEPDSRFRTTYTFSFTNNIINTFINDFNMPLENGNKQGGDATLYLKGTSGSMAIVDLFPNGVEDFKNEFANVLINEAQLVIYEDETMPTGPIDENGDAYHKYDRIYAYDIENNTTTQDYNNDIYSDTQTPYNSKFISLGLRDTITAKYKIRLTEHLKNILKNDSTNTKIGLVMSTNVNTINNADILDSNGDVVSVPSASVISPRGSIFYGSNAAVDESKRLQLKIFYTKPN